MAWIPPWTRDDDKRFELALVIFPEGSPSFLENIAQLLQKPLGLVKYHYDALVYDVALVESGKYALPKYPDDDNVSLTEATQSKHGIPWTEEEHREFVKTRTKIQVASHAQKYDKRQKLDINKRKRRSIHDITSESTMGKPDNFGGDDDDDD
ncbi:unnamed protein product [Arabidopsis halleri]